MVQSDCQSIENTWPIDIEDDSLGHAQVVLGPCEAVARAA